MNVVSSHKVTQNSEYFDAIENFDDLLNSSESSSVCIVSKKPQKEKSSSNSFDIYTRQETQSTYCTSQRSSGRQLELMLPPSLPLYKKSTKPFSARNFTNICLAQEVDLIQTAESKHWIVKFSPDCKALAVAGGSGVICVYEIFPSGSNASQLIAGVPSVIMAEHTAGITEISWSSEGMLISSSLDGTVKVWNKDIEHSLCTLEFSKQVYSVCFNPIHPEYFAMASSDNLLRVMKYPELNNEGFYHVPQKVMSLCYSKNGNFLAAGLERGEVLIYESKIDCKLRLKYKLKCKNRFGLKVLGRKVVGLQFMDDDYLLATTNDSRIRLFRFKEALMVQKYKGNSNSKYPIRADLSYDKKFLISGSENGLFYIWNSLRAFEKSPGKNGEFESYDARGVKKPEFSCFAPEKIVKAVKTKYKAETGNKVKYVILSVGSQSNLRVFYSLM